MTPFNHERAMRVLTKLEAEVTNSRGILGSVRLDGTANLLLPYPPGGESPTFTRYKWQCILHLSFEEFESLADCTLTGEEGLKLIRSRLCG
ncbi:MAG: hypothetical protein ACJ75T_02440 [Solirubrobacterales bacterium]